MIGESDRQFVQETIEAIVGDLGLEVVELTLKQNRKTVMIDVLADRVHGGITVDECSQINKKINALIEEKNLFNDDFVVEVSSPGLDRPLKTQKDFMRVQGKDVVVYLNDFVENKKEHSGKIVNVIETFVTLEVKGQEIIVPLDKINKAVQIL